MHPVLFILVYLFLTGLIFSPVIWSVVDYHRKYKRVAKELGWDDKD